jgi:hypothetical protein
MIGRDLKAWDALIPDPTQPSQNAPHWSISNAALWRYLRSTADTRDFLHEREEPRHGRPVVRRPDVQRKGSLSFALFDNRPPASNASNHCYKYCCPS